MQELFLGIVQLPESPDEHGGLSHWHPTKAVQMGTAVSIVQGRQSGSERGRTRPEPLAYGDGARAGPTKPTEPIFRTIPDHVPLGFGQAHRECHASQPPQTQSVNVPRPGAATKEPAVRNIVRFQC